MLLLEILVLSSPTALVLQTCAASALIMMLKRNKWVPFTIVTEVWAWRDGSDFLTHNTAPSKSCLNGIRRTCQYGKWLSCASTLQYLFNRYQRRT